MRKLLLAVGAAVGLLASGVLGQTINVGDLILLPNQANQSVTLAVTGGTQVAGLNFNVQVAGGGTANGGTVGPTITNVDLLTGTIFAGNNTGQSNLTTFPTQAYSGSVITSSGTVPASGTLATMTFNTTGLFGGGIYSLKLSGFSNSGVSGNTDFGSDANFNTIPANVTNGNLIVIYPGDINEDGSVNSADFNILKQHYGMTTGGTWALGDFNGDGKVDFNDFTLMTQYWNRSVNINPAPPSAAPAVVTAPEPASVAVLGLSTLLVLRRKRFLMR